MASEVILSVAGREMESRSSECRLDLLAYHQGVNVAKPLKQSLLYRTIGDNFEPKRAKARRLLGHLKSTYYDRSRLKQAIPLVVLIVYTVVGATIFYALEHQTDEQMSQSTSKRYERAKAEMCERIWELKLENFTKAKVLVQARLALDWFENEANLKGSNTNKVRPHWDFFGALIYVVTIYTTIGYGNIVPKTIPGRIFTIVYAVFGIPLMFSILSNLGNGVALGIHILWHLLLRLYGKICSFIGFSAPSQFVSSPASNNSASIDANSNEVKLYSIPLLFPIAITVGWMVMCSAVFIIWEDKWTLFGSFYFFFVSLTTIGLGDMVPLRYDFMTCSLPLIIIGLSLVSMCITIVNAKVDHLFVLKVNDLVAKYKDFLAASGVPLNDPQELDKFINGLPYWMKSLLSRDKKSRLVELMQIKREFANKLCQTDSPSDSCCSCGDQQGNPKSECDQLCSSSGIQSNTQTLNEISNGPPDPTPNPIVRVKSASSAVKKRDVNKTAISRAFSLQQSEFYRLPAKEVLPQGDITSTDDCKNLFNKIHYRINECRDLISSPLSPTQITFIDADSEFLMSEKF